MIYFFNEDSSYNLKDKLKIKRWIESVCLEYGKRKVDINFVLCSDTYLLNINQTYLNHDYYTDIITFDQSEKPKHLKSDIFISIERVKDNAKKNKIPFLSELHRVIIHGVLHMLGFKDKTSKERMDMRAKEDECLEKLKYKTLFLFEE
jgi:probable rRNA maturation factor